MLWKALLDVYYKLTFEILFSEFGQAFYTLTSVTLASLSFLQPNPAPQFQNALLYNWTLAQTAYMPFLKDALSFPASTFFFFLLLGFLLE